MKERRLQLHIFYFILCNVITYSIVLIIDHINNYINSVQHYTFICSFIWIGFSLSVFWIEHCCRWVREFLDEENQGLDALIDYLSFRLLMMRHEQRLLESYTNSEEKLQTGKKIKKIKSENLSYNLLDIHSA